MSEGKILNPELRCDEAKNFLDYLSSRVIGQERAVRRLADAYGLALSPLRERNRPIIFATYPGPSGTGKTYMAKCVAEYFFSDAAAFTKITCADFRGGHEVSKLIGAPAGYVGFYDPKDQRYGGVAPVLSQAKIDRFATNHLDGFVRADQEASKLLKNIAVLREHYNAQYAKDKDSPETVFAAQELKKAETAYSFRREEIRKLVLKKTNGELYSVVLFDEIEKAHGALHNFLLEVAGEGEASLQNGDKTTFANSFVFATSNIASQAMAKASSGVPTSIGFGATKGSSDPTYKQAVEGLKKIFPTELLGRLYDDVVVFRSLKEAELLHIAEQRVSDLNFRMQLRARMGEFRVSPEIIKMIVANALEHPEYGARQIVQKVQKLLEVPLSNICASNQVTTGDTISASLKDGRIVFERDRWDEIAFPEAVEAIQ